MSKWSRHVPGPAGDPEWERARRDHPAQGDGPGSPAAPGMASVWAETTWLEREDWDEIDALLGPAEAAAADGSVRADAGADAEADSRADITADIARASDQLCSLLTSEIISADRMTNPLLDFWSVARRAGPAVALPVEMLISALSQRQLVTAEEVRATCRAVADNDTAPRPLPAS